MKICRLLFFTILYVSAAIALAHAEGRGTWIVRFDIDTPEKVKQICSKENQQQFDRYLVQVRGRADSWYESAFVPKAEEVVDFDPLAAMIAECTDVEIHAWLNVYYLWTGEKPPVNPHHPYYNDDWILKDRTGRSVKDYSALEQRQRWIEGVYADPASPAYRAYFSDVVQELVSNYGVAGVHLDFVRYPGAFFGDGKQTDLVRMTRQDFAAWHNKSGDARAQAALSERIGWEQERADNVTHLVREVKQTMDQVNPELRLSASVFPDVIEAFLDKGQKWGDWLQEELLDDVYIMAYFGSLQRVASQIRQCKQVAARYNVTMWVGLGAYIKSAEDIQAEIASANGFGVTDVCLFSLGHLLRQNKDVVQYQLDETVAAPIEYGENALSPLVRRVLSDEFTLTRQPPHHSTSGRSQSITLRGIFRYVVAHDDYAKANDQYEIMEEVQDELLQGQPFAQVSRLYSQAGSKRDGGVLPELTYADARTKTLQSLFHLKTGEYSDILPVHNGFWLFQVVGKSTL
ncbi:MAG: family 10 glycosylhydrolase [Spirochaetales bacterium]|jgi:uncharacterized lipoprotein YddW (UPF0748 family)|nr:family 10 glycosylhydrolase [Spirochaetales bacterium]